MDARTVFDDLALTLGQPSPNLPSEARARILAEINATLQILATAPSDFFSLEDVTITATTATPSTTVSSDVISIKGQLRAQTSGESLVMIPTRGMFDNYGSLYAGQSDRTNTAGQPVACYIDGGKSSSAESGSDFSEVKAWFWPTPDASYSYIAECKKKPPTITLSDTCGTQQIVEIPDLDSVFADNTYIFLRGSRGTLGLWFAASLTQPAADNTGDPGNQLWRNATERAYVSTNGWTNVTTGSAILIAAIQPYYPTVYLNDSSDGDLFIHLGAYPYAASTIVTATSGNLVNAQAGVAPTAIPAPHGMMESIFMPIARYRLATFYRYFTDTEKLQFYAEQAAAAYAAVGLDPRMVSASFEVEGRREGAIRS